MKELLANLAPKTSLKFEHSELLDFMKALSLHRFSTITSHENMSVVEAIERPKGSHKAQIELVTDDIKLILRTVFDLDPKVDDNVPNSDVHMEFLNLIAGGVQGVLDRQGINARMSLPSSFSDFEPPHSEHISGLEFGDSWFVTGGSISLKIEMTLQIAHDSALNDLQFSNSEISESHTIEFF